MSLRLFLLPALLLAAWPAAHAQNATTTVTNTVAVRTRPVVGDRLVMRAGALTEINGRQGSQVDLDTVLPGGARVTPGGTIYMADGTTTKLQDGQTLLSGGAIRPATADEIAIANQTLSAGTAGVGQSLRDAAAEQHTAAVEAAAASAPNPNTNDRTNGALSRTPPVGATATANMSVDRPISAQGPTQNAPATPAPSSQTQIDIKRDQLRATRQLPSEQQ